jgi:hypothetical protein
VLTLGDGRVPLGISLDRSAFPDGHVDIMPPDQGACEVSFHGPGASGTRIDGEAVEPGRPYTLDRTRRIAFPDSVGVHLRPIGHGSSLVAPPDGPG